MTAVSLIVVFALLCGIPHSNCYNSNNYNNKQRSSKDKSGFDFLVVKELAHISHKVDSLAKRVDGYFKQIAGHAPQNNKLRADIAALDGRVKTHEEEQRKAFAKVTKTLLGLDKLDRKIDELTDAEKKSQNRGYNPGRHVFLIRSRQGMHRLSYYTASTGCKKHGGHLATKAQLDAAYHFGMDMCSCGWLLDKSIYYPTQWPRKWCGVNRGVNVCGGRHRDAYCFKFGYTGPLIALV